VAGDLLKDQLSLSPEDFAEITQNLQVIFNCAASVDFNQKLNEALQINTLGSLRMLELSKHCGNIENFV